jgi:hypothetical protein
MIKQYISFIGVSLLLVLFAPSVWAQGPGQMPPLSSPIPSPAPNSTADDTVTDIELPDSDLSVDLAAETLPTVNRLAYGWENMRNGVMRFFTLKAENKAELYERHLHTLDRKLAACAEIGDEQCTKQIEDRIEKLTTRATDYLARRQELKDKLLAKFQAWRERREALVTVRREQASQLQGQREELTTARKAMMDDARQNRAIRQEEMKAQLQERREQVKENVEQRQENREQFRQDTEEQRQLNLDQRRQNQEQLIEMRSGNLKNKLDAAEEQVQVRQEAVLNAE